MERSPCNVLVVPMGSPIHYEHIPLATDGSKHRAAAFAKVLAIARQCNSTLSLVAVIPPNAPPAELSKAESLVSHPFEVGYGL